MLSLQFPVIDLGLDPMGLNPFCNNFVDLLLIPDILNRQHTIMYH